jgi:uncharacterized protein (TIGR03437 family)
MGKLFLCCFAVALGIHAQTPRVTAVSNDRWSSPIVIPDAIGYVFGSNFGAANNTTVTVGGVDARVLFVSSNQIRVLFPPGLPAGLVPLTVTVDGRVSQAFNVTVSARSPGQASIGRGSVSAVPPAALSPPHTVEARMAPALLAASPATTADAGSGIVYTCDPTVDALSAGACNTLNTTIAALYSSAFSNANASIYVTLGSVGLGQSNWTYTSVPYSSYQEHLAAAAADANDNTAITVSVPPDNPYLGDMVGLVTALQRALGMTPRTGLETDGTLTVMAVLSFASAAAAAK